MIARALHKPQQQAFAQRGFTLIEVLVALIIIAIAFTGVIVSLGSSARFDAKVRDGQAAYWIAENEAAGLTMHLIQPPSSNDTTNRSLTMMHQKWVIKIKLISQQVIIDSANICVYHANPADGQPIGRPVANITTSFMHKPDLTGK